MKKILLILLVLAAAPLLFGCRGGGLLGRELASRAKDVQFGGGHKNDKAPIIFDTSPFDAGRSDLPPHYNGHDITEVYASFESGQHTGHGEEGPEAAWAAGHAFRESIAAGPPGNQLWYDADHGLFKVRIRVEPCFDAEGNIEAEKFALVVVGYHHEAKGRLPAQEATKWILWEVSGTDGQSLGKKIEGDRSGAYISLHGKTSTDEPPLPKDISVLLVCAPRASAEGLSIGPGLSPTIPGNGFGHYYLISDLLELWVYDYATGRVFLKEQITPYRLAPGRQK